jgi:CubicO group peptidase (beta-lactamase class C family)
MKKAKILVLVFSFVLSVFSQTSFSQSSKARKIDEFIAPFAKANHFSGVVLASENGKVIYEKAFGIANADYKIPNQLNTRIGIASITKPMTVVILNRLVESGKISLNDKLSKYIPDFPNGDKITIGILKNHRSGIPHRIMPSEMETVSYTSAEFVEKVKQAKLAFEPGSQRLYSSAGFSVLARALEIASGKSYAQLLQEYVFAPADMKDSLDFKGEMIMERRAQDYLFDSNGYVNAPLRDYSFLVGAGSVFSTARDVYKFGEAVLDGKYGENSKTDLIRETTISASGTTNGHRAYLEIERDKKYGYVLLSNLPTGAFDIISQGLTDILQGKEAKPVAPSPKIIPNPNKNTAEFSGRYKRTDGVEIGVILRNDSLYTLDSKLHPIKPDCFFEYKYYGEVCFTREESGKIKEMKWKGNGFEYFYVKQ